MTSPTDNNNLRNGLGAIVLLALLCLGMWFAWNGFVYDVLGLGHRMSIMGALSLELWLFLFLGISYLFKETL